MERLREAIDAALIEAHEWVLGALRAGVDLASRGEGPGLVLGSTVVLAVVVTLVLVGRRRHRDLGLFRKISCRTKSAGSSEELTAILFDAVFAALGVPAAASYLSHGPGGFFLLRASRINPATPAKRRPDWTPEGSVELRDTPWRDRQGTLIVCSFPFTVEGRVQALVRMCVATERDARRLEASRGRLESLLTPLLSHLTVRERIDRLEERAREVSAISDSSQVLLSATFGMEALGQMLVDLAVRGTGSDGGLVMVDDESDPKRKGILAAVGLDTRLLQALVAEAESASWASPTRGTVVSLAEPDGAPVALLRREGFRALLQAPLVMGKVSVGRVALMRRAGDFGEHQLQVCALIAARLSFGIRNRLYHEAVFDEYREILRSMVATYEASVPNMRGHSGRVASLGTHLARLLGLSEGEIEGIRQAGEFHDVGMVGVGREVLSKSDRFTEGEYNLVKFHPAIGGALTAPMRLPVPIGPLVLHHHERFDGLGYPGGLRGSAIPLGARILALAEIFDAMVSARVYRAALPFGEAQQRMAALAGTQLDPTIVDLFIRSVTPETWNSMAEGAAASGPLGDS